MSDSVRPHRRQPTRLRRPWNSPSKNTEVGCHFLLQCMKVKSESESFSCVQLLVTPWTAAHQAPPSMGFSRQEYWSRLPLPSPLCYTVGPYCVLSPSVMSNSLQPHEVEPQPLLSMEFSRQEYWSGLPVSTQGIFSIQGSNLHLLHLLLWKADSLPLCHL